MELELLECVSFKFGFIREIFMFIEFVMVVFLENLVK